MTKNKIQRMRVHMYITGQVHILLLCAHHQSTHYNYMTRSKCTCVSDGSTVHVQAIIGHTHVHYMIQSRFATHACVYTGVVQSSNQTAFKYIKIIIFV